MVCGISITESTDMHLKAKLDRQLVYSKDMKYTDQIITDS